MLPNLGVYLLCYLNKKCLPVLLSEVEILVPHQLLYFLLWFTLAQAFQSFSEIDTWKAVIFLILSTNSSTGQDTIIHRR